MKVWISVHGRFHAFDLARELAEASALSGIATTYPSYLVRRWLPSGIPVASAPWLEAMRRAAPAVGCDRLLEPHIARWFSRFSAQHIPHDIDVFVGWSGASLEALEVARAKGARIVIERGSTHILHQAELLDAEYESFGIRKTAVAERMIERELAEYAAADAIAVPSRAAASTFVARGHRPEQLIVNAYGTDLSRFESLGQREARQSVRILFVGGVGFRKGVPWLLKAAKKLPARAELHLVGPVEPEMWDILRRDKSERVIIRGPLQSQDVTRAFRDADVFCLPSLEEGLALSCLQAMAAGLPVVVTPATGITDLIVDGREGVIVAPRDTEGLVGALTGLVEDRQRRLAMGEAARRTVATGFRWQDYGRRALNAYARLCGQPSSALH